MSAACVRCIRIRRRRQVASRKPLNEIKTMRDDAAAVEKESEAIKARYSKIFHV